MTRSGVMRNLLAVVSASGLFVALVGPIPAWADGITVTRNCADADDAPCGVQVEPTGAAAVAVAGPATGLGPAIELNLAVDQVADAGTPAQVTHGSGAPATATAGAAVNGFQVSLGQSGTATATSGNATSDGTGAQAGGSTAIQNPPGAGSDPGAGADPGGGSNSPPSGGSTSGVNMITNVASIVQIVQVVARNNSNTTIAPVQLAEQCQQAAVSCSGNQPSHP